MSNPDSERRDIVLRLLVTLAAELLLNDEQQPQAAPPKPGASLEAPPPPRVPQDMHLRQDGGAHHSLQTELRYRYNIGRARWVDRVRAANGPAENAAKIMADARASGLLNYYPLAEIFEAQAWLEARGDTALATADKRRAPRKAALVDLDAP